MTLSLYQDTFSKDSSIASPEAIIQNIFSGLWKDTIEYLRKLNKSEYDAEKKKLNAVTWSGTFSPGTRSIKTLTSYSHLVVIDVDKLDHSVIPALKQQLSTDDHVRYCFISPSGTGVKIIVQVNTGAEDHRSAFLHLQDYFEKRYFIKVDPSGKDVCRLCYVSYDPMPIINKDSKVFEVDLKYGIVISEYKTTYEGLKAMTEADKIFPVCQKWIEKKFTYIEGQRNIYLHALSCALNRCGVTQEDCIRLIYQHYPVPDDVWIQSVKSAYFHGMWEHGSYRVKDLGTQEFIAPPYVGNFTDDIVANDIMTITSMLFTYKLPSNEIMNIVHKIGMFYDSKGYIDLRRANLTDLMNAAIQKLNENIATNASKLSLKYESAEDIGMELVNMDLSGGIKLYIPILDDIMGGLFVSNFYAFIGFGGTFKSVLAQFTTYKAAMDGIPVLYLNGEMSKMQFYERMALQVFGINLRAELSSGRLNKENIGSFIEQMQQATKKNIFVFSGTGWNKASILATIDHIYATTGKKVKLVFMDGLSQMDQAGKEEAPANIYNSGVCKEIVKSAHGGEGVAMIALIHCSGQENKTIRDTGKVVRGGSKMLANMDGYFSTSIFIDQTASNPDNANDIIFLENKFCLRYTDKRSGTGVTTLVVNVQRNLMVETEDTDYRNYEAKG